MKAKLLAVVTALILLCSGVGIWVFVKWQNAPNWPDLLSTTDGNPSVYVEVKPDFGYNIGDVLPITIFIKQAPNTVVDLDSIALEGDFEIKGDFTVIRKSNPKTSFEMIAVKLYLQSFTLKDVLKSNVSLTWNKSGTTDYNEVTVPALEIHLSRLYDGRPVPQEGEQLFVTGNHLLVSTILAIIGSAGTIICAVWLTYFYANNKLFSQYKKADKRALVKQQFEVIWTKIVAGDQSEANFREIAILIRNLLGIQTTVLSKLPALFKQKNFIAHGNRVLFILDRCEKVIYREDKSLSEAELAKLKQAFDEFIDNQLLANDEYLYSKRKKGKQ
jgi:hypothetical protein